MTKRWVNSEQILNFHSKVNDYLKIVKRHYGLYACIKVFDYVLNVKVTYDIYKSYREDNISKDVF